MEFKQRKQEQKASEPVVHNARSERPAVTSAAHWPLAFNGADSPALRLSQACNLSPTPLRPTLQAKLSISEPGDQYEQEADRVADQVMRMPDPAVRLQRKCGCGGVGATGTGCDDCAGTVVQLQRHATPHTGPGSTAPSSVHDVLRSPGQPLGQATRDFFEARFGQDFSRVRVHYGTQAAASAREVNALAYTVGSNVVFAAGQYAPGSRAGERLLAHELTHVLQQTGKKASSGRTGPVTKTNDNVIQRYTAEERRAMREGRVQATANDQAIATARGFQPGDIVFRLGSRSLASRIGEAVTHGGIYLGGGLIHDMVGFGNRTVGATNFFREADDPSVVRILRFTGPHRDLIIERLIRNIRALHFDLPTDPVPFNLFSSADDYRTATCLEYSHAQILLAIRELSVDTGVDAGTRNSLRSAYFAQGATAPSALIRPRTLTIEGQMGIAINERRALVAAATASGDSGGDIDPTVFSNRWEGEEELRVIGSSLAPVVWQTERLRTFTYGSFVDSRQFFTQITPGVLPTPSEPTTRCERRYLGYGEYLGEDCIIRVGPGPKF